jgi:hypothetical protein
MEFKAVEDEVERLDVMIKAAEDWSHEYRKDPKTHAKLIRLESKLERLMRGYFRDLSERAGSYVNWSAYYGQVKSFQVDVIIEDEDLDGEDDVVLKILYDPIASGVALGAVAGETIYEIPLGMSETSASVQQAAREMIANLVGKRIDKNGIIIDNPRADYRITDKTRQDIRESIRTSLNLGEDIQSATERLRRTINNPKRAEVIARTETVNAYNKGLSVFANESGAIGKEWQDFGANDICAVNSNAGVIPLSESFPSGDSEPAAHPNCRCGMRIVYQEENSI